MKKMSKEPKRNVYVGHRYVPKVMGEWDKTESYEGLSIVTNEGTSYTSKKRVPKGIDILNEEYWVVTGNYNAQIEEYRKDVRELEKEVGKKSDQSYVDNLNEKVNIQLTQIEKEVGKKSDQSYVNNLNKKVNIQLTQIEKEVGKKSDQSYVDNLNEKVNAQLTQTKYLATRPRGLEDLKPEVLAAIEGGEGTSFELLTKPQERSVEPISTT